MNRKQLILVLIFGVVVCGLGFWLYKGQEASYTASEQTLGKKLLADLPINDVARIVVKHDTNELNLVKQDELWKVKERWNYPANFSEISEFVRKASELKAVQNVKVGPSQLGRLELDKSTKGTNAPTLVEFQDKGGKTLKTLVLGKKYLRNSRDSSPYGGGDWPVGRYVMTPGNPQSEGWVVSDPLTNVET